MVFQLLCVYRWVQDLATGPVVGWLVTRVGAVVPAVAYWQYDCDCQMVGEYHYSRRLRRGQKV